MVSNEKNQSASASGQARTRPFTSREFLDSVRDDREIWIYGERVKDVTTHPAFRNTVRMMARLYDALHDQREGRSLHRDRYRQRRLHAQILQSSTQRGRNGGSARCHRRVGARDVRLDGPQPRLQGRVSCHAGRELGLLHAVQENARRWYKKVQEEVTFVNHAIVNPPVDRNKPLDEVRDVYMHVEKETDGGLIVSGAKVVATTSTLTHYNFIANNGALPIKTKDFAFVCIVPTDAPGLKLFCRPSYEMTAASYGQPVRLPAFQPDRRERFDPRVRQSFRAVGKCVRLWRHREGEQLLPALRISSAFHVPRLHALGGETRFHCRAAAEGR